MIKEILKNLDPRDFGLLTYAFEQKITKMIRLKGGKFIGVHIVESDSITIEEKSGVWSYGTVKE